MRKDYGAELTVKELLNMEREPSKRLSDRSSCGTCYRSDPGVDPTLQTEADIPANQLGSLERRRWTAAPRNAPATARPIHRPGLFRNLPGLICTMGSVGNISPSVNAIPGVAPRMREPTIVTKCDVWNAIFSTPPIATRGSAAQRNVDIERPDPLTRLFHGPELSNTVPILRVYNVSPSP